MKLYLNYTMILVFVVSIVLAVNTTGLVALIATTVAWTLGALFAIPLVLILCVLLFWVLDK